MYQNKRLQTKHHEIIRRAHLGQSNVTIAAELGLSALTVGIILRSTVAQREVLRLRDVDAEKTANTPARVRLQAELNEAAELSMKHHLSILRNEVPVDEKIKVAISRQHVEQGIYKTETEDNVTSFRDIIRGLAIVERALEDRGNVIDITPNK